MQFPKMTVSDTTIKIITPYHPDFNKVAARLNGKFNRGQAGGGSWSFNIKDLDHVARLLTQVYGVNGLQSNPPLVDVQITITEAFGGNELFLLGRQVFKRWGRDSRVTLGDDVSVISGKFASRGGSVKNPVLFGSNGAFELPIIVNLYNVPQILVENYDESFDLKVLPSAMPVAPSVAKCSKCGSTMFVGDSGIEPSLDDNRTAEQLIVCNDCHHGMVLVFQEVKVIEISESTRFSE